MAVVWYEHSGSGARSWDVVERWKTWDEDTQSIVLLGRLPRYPDEIYLNGIEYFGANTGIDTSVVIDGVRHYATIRNSVNPYTQIGGGYIAANSVPIIANVVASGNSTMFSRETTSAGHTLQLIGDSFVIENGASLFGRGGSYNRNLTITITNGGTFIANGIIITNSSGTRSLTISGNNATVELNYTQSIGDFSCSCDIINNSNCTFTTATIGNIRCSMNNTINGTTLNISGSIEYESTQNKNGIVYNDLNVINPQVFTWKDITSPRTNSYVIVTDAEMSDDYLYPNPSVVRFGINYAANQRTGTYTPDYPIPQNVMKDVEYDSGLLIGTLEFPTTSDIVNAIKNDSDLGVKIDTTNTNVGNISTAVTTIDGKVDIIDTNIDTLLSRLTSVLTQRLGQSVTVEILQQILVAHLDN